MNITDALYVHARDRPEHLAVEDGKRIISYSKLAAMVDHAAIRAVRAAKLLTEPPAPEPALVSLRAAFSKALDCRHLIRNT